MLAGLSASEQDEAWDEIEEHLKTYEQNGWFNGPCQMLVAAATKAG